MPKSKIMIEIFQDQVHVFQVFAFLNEKMALLSLKKAGDFIKNITSNLNEVKPFISFIDKRGESTGLSRQDAMDMIQLGKIELEKIAQSQSVKQNSQTTKFSSEPANSRALAFYRLM
jgi:hypothetical protein